METASCRGEDRYVVRGSAIAVTPNRDVYRFIRSIQLRRYAWRITEAHCRFESLSDAEISCRINPQEKRVTQISRELSLFRVESFATNVRADNQIVERKRKKENEDQEATTYRHAYYSHV